MTHRFKKERINKNKYVITSRDEKNTYLRVFK